ncbi:hypothetical protein AALO_G00171040 [Alosa alosa]|uniref:Centrosomin N-terminal motif 1 domain-containing protein n=1 Tax=Alosa alosa TaxID=278164 RepID=A0AAV6GCU8_9TELE|nr:hypothetical protein AALO_G00171040 [Alosa alosa]
MDSVVGEDQTLPFDINGSTFTRLPDGLAEFSMDAPTFPPGKISPSKALTMKDYENQITALKKENFNLKLRIYFLEERMQQKCDDSTEDIYKTNIELKVEVESLKRDLSEKQELLVSASKALESLANRDVTDSAKIRERAQREMDSLRDMLNQRIQELEESLQEAQGEMERMAAIAEQHKRNNMDLQKQLQNHSQSQPSVRPDPTNHLQALQEKDRLIGELQASAKKQDDLIGQLQQGSAEQPAAAQIAQLDTLIGQKDGELQALKDELNVEKMKAEREIKVCEQKLSEVARLEAAAKQLTQELSSIKTKNQSLESDNQELTGKLEEKEGELDKEKKNGVKRDKTIQGLSLVLKEKEKEIEDLYHDLEDRDQALAKARDALHKAQLQKYQGAEEQQKLLLERQMEVARLQGDLHACLSECKRLERIVSGRDTEVQRLIHERQTLQDELDALLQTKQRQDKTINDLQNQLKKLSSELGAKQSEREKEHSEELEESKRREHTHESTIQRLTHTLTHKEQQLQEYMNMLRDVEQGTSPAGSEVMVSKLRERLKEKEKALEAALDEKFSAVEEKENEVHQLQLSLREKERDLERLNNLLTHNQETISGLDALVKERDVDLQQQVNSLKNLQRSKQSTEDSLNRALREKDSLIQQLQHALESKTKDLEELSASLLSKPQQQQSDVTERLTQRLKVAEAELAAALKERERLLNEHQSTVDTLLSTISSKEQLLQDSSERHSRGLRERDAELQELRDRLAHLQRQLSDAHTHSTTTTQNSQLTSAQLRAQLAEKDDLINKLLEQGQERDRYLAELKTDAATPQVLELRQTIQLLQQQLEERDDELNEKGSDESPKEKKSVAALKKQLAVKTENLNKALKREEELKSLVAALKGQLKDQTESIETLTHTLTTKEETIIQLQRDECRGPGPPERENTSIGGDSKETLPPLSALRVEWEGLNRSLRAEQQLYSNLVRSVKQQDSASRLQSLQLELTAVQLLRQQLEASIQANEQLREQLEQDLQRANQREGEELQSVRSALEEARRWNASLQTRLGQIQSRGGGVGQANDTGDFPSVIADQTSYMSICLGETEETELDQLSVSQLKLKVAELQALNAELQKKVAVTPERQPHSQQAEIAERDSPERRRSIHTQVGGVARSPVGGSSESVSLAGLSTVHLSIQHEVLLSDQSSDHRSQTTSPVRSSQKEQRSRESKESADASCDSDGPGIGVDLRHTIQCLRSEARGHRQVIRQLKEQLQRSSTQSDGAGAGFDPELIVSMAREMERLREENEASSRRARSLEGKLLQEIEDKERQERERRAEESEGGQGETTRRERERRKERRERGAGERGTESRDDESASSKSSSPNRKTVNLMAKHTAYVKSRLPVLARSSRQAERPGVDHPVCDGGPESWAPYPAQRRLLGAEDQPASPRSSQQSSPGTASSSRSPAHSAQNLGLDGGLVLSLELETQLELLQQECQEKEGLLQRKAEQWERLQAELQEKDRLMREYLQALKAAESTIAYLTACSLDAQTGVAPGGRPQSQEPEPLGLSSRLQECVRRVEEAITALTQSESEAGHSHAPELLARLEELQEEVQALRDPEQVQRQADAIQEALWEQSRLNAELQERLRAAEAQLKAYANAKGDHGPTAVDATPSTDANNAKATDNKHRSPAKTKPGSSANEVSMAAASPSLSPDSSSASTGQGGNNNNNSSCSPIEVEGLQSGKSRRVLPKMADLRGNAQREECLRECVRAAEGAVDALVACCSSADPSDLSDPHRASDHSAASPNATLAQQMNRLLHVLHQKSRLDRLAPSHTSTPKVQTNPALILITPLPEGSLPQMPSEIGSEHSPVPHAQQSPSKSRPHSGSASKNQQSPTKSRAQSSPAHQSKQIPLKSKPHPGQAPQDLHHNLLLLLQLFRERAQRVAMLEEQLASLQDKLQASQAAKHRDVDVVLDTASSPSYPSSPGLSLTPRPQADLCDPDACDLALLRQQLAQLRAQVEGQQKVIQHLQAGRRRSSLPVELLTPTCGAEREGAEEVDERRGRREQKGHLHLGTGDLDKDRTPNRSLCQSASPSRIESLVQSQARELCELRCQIRMSGVLGVEQRRVLLDLRGALEDMLQAAQQQPHLGQHIQHSLDRSLELLDTLQPGGTSPRDQGQGLEHGLEQIQSVCSELQQKSRLIRSLQEQLGVKSPSSHQGSVSNDNSTASYHNSPPTGPRATGLKLTNGVATASEGLVSVETDEGSVRALRRENGRLQEQLHRTQPTGPLIQICWLSTCRRSELCASGLEETIRTNERLREQLERRLQEAQRDPAGTNIFIAGLEDQGQLANEVRKLWAHNHTLREQLNQGSRDKQKENERLRETLARRTAKLERSRREHTHLQESLHRLQCEVKKQKQQLSDSQHLLKSLRVELKLQEHIRNTEGDEQPSGVDLTALLAEVRHLREQLERSIRNHTININYLLPSDECGRSEQLNLSSHPDANTGQDSGSSVGSGSPPPSRLVPGVRVFEARGGQHVLGLSEDYSALHTHLTQAITYTQHMDEHTRDCNTAQCKNLSTSVNSMHQVLEEASRLLKLFWRVSLPADALRPQDEMMRTEISRLKSRLQQQECVLSGAVKRLHSTNQLKEGMERLIIDQLSVTHGILKKARGNLEDVPLSGQ